ncbi:MAG: carbohydrate ABC transporter permease [Bacteroidota bacterium]
MKRRVRLAIPFLLPAVLLYGLFFIYPGLKAFYVSLHEWSGFTANMKYVGVSNFKELFYDEIFRGALKNNIFLVIIGGILIIVLALFFANLIKQSRPRTEKLKTTAIFMPHLFNTVSVSILWIFIYNPRWGLLNGILDAVGLGGLARPWLGDPKTIMWAILLPLLWWSVGFYMLILKASMDRIPYTFFEAAQIDGASKWQMFRRLTLPLISDVVLICAVLWTVSALKQFGLVFSMTGGGPSNASQLIAVYLFETAFEAPGGQGSILRMGYATAMAVVLFFFVVAFSVIQLLLRRRESYEY